MLANGLPAIILDGKGSDACPIGRHWSVIHWTNGESVDSTLVYVIATVNFNLIFGNIYWIHDDGMISFIEREPIR